MGIQRIEHFLTNINNASIDQINTVCLEEMNYLRENYPALSSFRSALTSYRKAVEIQVDDEDKRLRTVKSLHLTRKENKNLDQAKEKQIAGDLLHQRPIYNLDAHINLATKLLDSNSYQDKILGLCALTGRRTAEIACTAQLNLIPDDDYTVMFTGQLKTKNRGVLPAFEIPVLCNSTKLINALHAVREAKPMFMDNMPRFHNAASSDVNKKCKKLFFNVSDAPISPKDLRSIYAEISYLYLDDVTIAKPKYFSLILGHGEEDNSTALSYLDFYIPE